MFRWPGREAPNRSAHHSQTLPVVLCRPKPLGG